MIFIPFYDDFGVSMIKDTIKIAAAAVFFGEKRLFRNFSARYFIMIMPDGALFTQVPAAKTVPAARGKFFLYKKSFPRALRKVFLYKKSFPAAVPKALYAYNILILVEIIAS